MVLVDTSGSMVWHFNDCSGAGGDGSKGDAAYCDNGINGSSFTCAANATCSPSTGAALFQANADNPSRLLAAKAALNDVINSSSGSIDFGLERYAIATAADFRAGTPTICADANNCCVTPAGSSTATKGRCVPELFSSYPNVPGSVSCVGTISSPCNLTYVGGCGANGLGGQILVTPGNGSSTSVLPWVDFVEDFCSSTASAGGPPRNPELRGAGNTPLAGSVRTALGWYEGVYEASKLVSPIPTPTPSPSPSPLPEAADPQIDCRPYVFVVMTDGGEMCENPSAAVQAVEALGSINPNNPVKTYVLGMAFVQDELCASTAADGVSCPMTGGCKTVNGQSLCGCDPAQNNSDGTNAACGTTCERFAYVCGADGVCHHPALDTLNAMAMAGGTVTPRFANSQADIEAVFADIVASTVLIEKCNGIDDDCNGACDEPFPDVAVSASPAPGKHCSNPRTAKACDNGQLAGTHCFAAGSFVCSTDHTSEVCGAATCATDSTLCPAVETCDGEDNDCNGVIDDCVPFVAGSCCAVTCPACNPTGVPQPETCNGCDDDCDGIVDDHLVDPRVGVVGGPPCVPLPAGQTMPPCNPGMTACVAGQVVCTNEVQPTPNQCGMSTDCTGVMTTGSCPDGTTCVQGNCAVPCANSEFPCPGGFICKQSTMLCIPNACATKNCPSDQLCQLDSEGNASCIDPCTLLNCPVGYACKSGACVDNSCRVNGCAAGQVCIGDPPACIADPCAGVSCPSGQFCDTGGTCEKACVPGCLSTQVCMNGACIDGKCKGVTCPTGQTCLASSTVGVCQPNACGASCASGQVCCGGSCQVDPCANLHCPDSTRCVIEETCGASCQGPHDDRISPAGGGGLTCEVSSGGSTTPAALFALLVMIGLLRRRARLLVLLSALAAMTGCRANNYCLNCGPNGEPLDLSSAAPSDLAGVDFAGAGGDGGPCVPSNNGVEICDHLDNNCNGVVDDVSQAQLVGDPNNCGACFNRCDFTSLHEFGACVGGFDGGTPMCQPSGCVPGFVDLNHDPSDGCEYACTPTGPEICDGVDNDCNGLIDDNPSQPTSLTCSTQGVCAGHTIPFECEGLSGWRCDYSTVPNADVDTNGNLLALETHCDGLDNNCNGVVDKDGFPTLGSACTAGLGVCLNSGTVICATATAIGCSASPSPARATDELCNGLDDDCNGLVDEPDDYRDPLSGKLFHGWHDAMVKLPTGTFVYAYEASRPDASGASQGGNSSRACSQPAVLPWADVTEIQAQAACAAVRDGAGAPMRLCTAPEWQKACEGPTPSPTQWSFSSAPSVYASGVCNDVNLQPTPAPWSTGTVGPNGTKHCFVDWTPSPSPSPIYDLSGNLKEWTSTAVLSGGTTYYELRGGAFDSLSNGTTCELAFDIAQPGFVDNDVGFLWCADHAPCGDTQSDPNNCGFCGNICGGGTPVCLNGACAASCGGLTNCSNACVNLTNDPAHCSACGTACVAGQNCISSACVCAGSTTLCGGRCVNTSVDPRNCGGCGTTCMNGQVCNAGSCMTNCGALSDCGGSCVDEQTDHGNCGGCLLACAPAETCASGGCCGPPLSVCSGQCVDEQSDDNHCGDCTTICASGVDHCSAGICCSAGFEHCGGPSCTNVGTDNANCGACGNVCSGGSICCGGACVDATTDSANCGGCSIHCVAGDACLPPSPGPGVSACCAAGTANCGGTCANLLTDSSNCGVCGNHCSVGSCAGGSCSGCPSGQSFCNGKCIATSNDPNNCGGCGPSTGGSGHVCTPVTQVCESNKCVAVTECATNLGLTACSGTCVDTQTDNNNCGACGITGASHVCGAGKGCVQGSCVNAVVLTGNPACSPNPGPVITFTDGTVQNTTCSGNDAATTFAFGLCTCTDLGFSASATIDAFDSTAGPYDGTATGGSVGVNGNFVSSASLVIGGDLWCEGTAANGLNNVTVDEQLHVGLATKIVGNVGGNGFISAFSGSGNNITFSGGAADTLFTPSCPPPANNIKNPQPVCSASPVPTPQPCERCSPAQQVPVASYIAYYQTHNDDASIGLSPAAFHTVSAPVRLDLPCGVYYVDYINANNQPVTIAAHGNTALFVGSSINVKQFDVAVDPAAQLDLFVGNDINLAGPADIGNPGYPSQLRVYIGGTCLGSTSADACVADGDCCTLNCQGGGHCNVGNPEDHPWILRSSTSLSIGADIYGPNGLFRTSASASIFGAIFVKWLESSASFNLHYDKGNADEGQQCGSSTGQGCQTCLDCGNQACNAGVCGSCSSDSDCCAPLRCVGGNCQFTSF